VAEHGVPKRQLPATAEELIRPVFAA
jgi:hypothetical protein